MNIIEVMRNFPDEKSCVSFLEEKRWSSGVCCPRCGSVDVNRRSKTDPLLGWNCNVKTGTIFQGTKSPLDTWFIGISMISNAKKGISSCQLARDLGMNQKSVWFMAMRVRKAMKTNDPLLIGIIEADETYVGGKPRKGRDKKSKRGRGTKKSPVVGAVERGGRVVANVMETITGKKLKDFLLSNINPEKSILMTDQYPSYNALDDSVERFVVNHQELYVAEDGVTHTNTIEGFWAGIKRAFYGTHHHYSKKWIQRYIDEAVFKYNHRKSLTASGLHPTQLPSPSNCSN